MTTTAQNILKTLGYFDLFQYPLTREEIYLFHAKDISVLVLNLELDVLVADKLVYKIDNFYSVHNNTALAERRRKGNLLAGSQLLTARRVAKFLSAFPYVKAVAVSGSLSKNFATEKTDIDFFVITAANRLWIARTCMHLYKKLTFISGKQNWFCMNYYVDEEAMEIKEKNIFTAVEIATLVPMQGKTSLDKFTASNNWINSFLPLHQPAPAPVPEIKPNIFRRLVETVCNGMPGSYIDTQLMKITKKRWQRKTAQGRLNSRGVCMGMLVDRHFSKPDPRNFQQKVVEGYRAKVQELLRQKNITVSLI